MNAFPTNEFPSDDALFEDMERHVYEPLPSDVVAAEWLELPTIEQDWLDLPTIEHEWMETSWLQPEQLSPLPEQTNDMDLDLDF